MENPRRTFNQTIRERYQFLLSNWQSRIPEDERLRIDLHCHDTNSDITDELWGRILRVPETWVTTDELVQSLQSTGNQALTITNHNNARSCWQLLEKGIDVLVGAEFSCTLPEEDVRLHVLAYGFTPDQEAKLNQYRDNLYRFLTYTVERDIPTVLAHPLYFYSKQSQPNISLFEKLTLLFERFEVANGQRDVWQNLLIWQWLDDLTEEKIDSWRGQTRD